MTYIDTSAFLHWFRGDVHSENVKTCLAGETSVLISPITLLEIRVQIRSLGLGGKLRPNQVEKLERQLSSIWEMEPFELVELSARLFETAIKQHKKTNVHCRSLDRLHLAAMEELRARRLITYDTRQAEAARELGIEVVMPGM